MKTAMYKTAFKLATNDVAEGWFDPADYNRESLKNHLLSVDTYSADYLEGYCDGAFSRPASESVVSYDPADFRVIPAE